MSKPINDRKVAIIGCGFVGSSSAFALMQSGLFSEIVLVDVDRNRVDQVLAWQETATDSAKIAQATTPDV